MHNDFYLSSLLTESVQVKCSSDAHVQVQVMVKHEDHISKLLEEGGEGCVFPKYLGGVDTSHGSVPMGHSMFTHAVAVNKNGVAVLNDFEVKIQLPHRLLPTHHLLFCFWNVTLKNGNKVRCHYHGVQKSEV